MSEVERKWLIKELPDLTGKKVVLYERYFLFIDTQREIRIQKKGDVYEFERKVQVSDLTRDVQKFKISEEEFLELKKQAVRSIIREGYLFLNSPNISIKIYHGDYENLLRAEVEFENEEDAKEFIPLPWFGNEITHTYLARDKDLVGLSREDFLSILATIK